MKEKKKFQRWSYQSRITNVHCPTHNRLLRLLLPLSAPRVFNKNESHGVFLKFAFQLILNRFQKLIITWKVDFSGYTVKGFPFRYQCKKCKLLFTINEFWNFLKKIQAFIFPELQKKIQLNKINVFFTTIHQQTTDTFCSSVKRVFFPLSKEKKKTYACFFLSYNASKILGILSLNY